MASRRGSSLNQEEASETSDLLQLALDFLEGRQVHSLVQRLGEVALKDLFRLLERLTSLVKRNELRRVRELLVELTIVRENTLLQDRSEYEAELIKTIKQSGRLGEFVGLILTGSQKLDV